MIVDWCHGALGGPKKKFAKVNNQTLDNKLAATARNNKMHMISAAATHIESGTQTSSLLAFRCACISNAWAVHV